MKRLVRDNRGSQIAFNKNGEGFNLISFFSTDDGRFTMNIPLLFVSATLIILLYSKYIKH